MNSQSVGVFDSGVGGISVLRHVRTELPEEDLLYFADSLYAPYGNKTPDFIIARSNLIADFLVGQGAKSLVVACNTATAAAIASLRARYTIPIIGMEPAVKPAAAVTRSGVVGVLATVGTLKSAQFAALLENYGQNIQVVTQGCEGLVECVERGELDTESTRTLLLGYLAPLLERGADTIVLGCTHYPFLRPVLETLVPQGTAIVDTGAAVARHLKHMLENAGLLNPIKQPGTTKFWTNHPSAEASCVIHRLWGEQHPAAVVRMDY